MARRGPRTDGADTRAAIVDVAREHFADRGYDGTSLRGIARDAGVDPALVHHYFDGKAALFAATIGVPADPEVLVGRIVDGPRDAVGERLVTTFLDVWDDPATAGRPRAVLSALLSSDAGFAPVRGFLLAEVFGRVTRELDVDEPARRAGLVGAQLVGLLVARHVAGLPGVADAPREQVVADVAPVLQRYLTAPLP